ncbi:MAG: calcium-translocating P-type ATPase, PMCA-type [Clostridia bacterium]|nr:calcium-translocating P-type ATPase, PMCA-type [Clostridia bacterium]
MWHTIEKTDLARKLKTNLLYGITEEEAEERLEKYGKNKIEDKQKEHILIKFIKQFNDIMIIILIASAVISTIITKIQGSNDYLDSIIIIAIVVMNAIMGTIQEAKAEKSIEALKKLSTPIVKVKRSGNIYAVPSEDITIGDLIILEAGNYVPADCRIIKSYNLKIEESSLTGETVPVIKNENVKLNENCALADMENMAFGTTIVTNGSGEAIVTDIGMNTKVGKIAKMIISDESPETPIQKKLGQVGKVLGIGCLFICTTIFFMGILKKIPPVEMFMTSVGLAVAAIPEGLPAIVTIVLSIGVTKLAKHKSIIRKLPAVETLGSSSVICSDKTGTLTKNEMNIVEYEDLHGKKSDFILELATMCTSVQLQNNGEILGDPTEIAIVQKANDLSKNRNDLYLKYPKINEIPFDSNRKLMTTIHKFGNKYRIITKGAPDILLERCTKVYDNGNIEELSYSSVNFLKKRNETMANKALRVIAVAYLDLDIIPQIIDSEFAENNLIFVGLIAMMDPPREGVKEAVQKCKEAGIKIAMITGDHISTARAIAQELGIFEKNDKFITGKELDNIDQKDLERTIMRYSVFARVSPEHKVRIVKAYRASGAVVAMTGDGVNDAPALKIADIGISMGLNGTDVAKNASDMVLADDNFSTIVEAVKYGRNIFDNIKKAIHFLIATNIAEIATIFFGLLIGFKSPLTAIQLLWINLITDSLPAIALGLQPAEQNIMKIKPRKANKSLFADGLWSKIIAEGFFLGTLTLFTFYVGYNKFGLEVARTMTFFTLSMLELIHAINVKSEESIFKSNIFTDKYLIGAFLAGTILQIMVMVVPFLANIFEVTSLNTSQWIYIVIISFASILIMEVQKFLNRAKLPSKYEKKILNIGIEHKI